MMDIRTLMVILTSRFSRNIAVHEHPLVFFWGGGGQVAKFLLNKGRIIPREKWDMLDEPTTQDARG